MNRRLLTLIASATLLSLFGNALAQEALVPRERLEECSKSALEFANRVHKVTLDFSPRSLGYVDGMMLDFYTRKFPFTRVENHVLVMGCYAGEVFIRNLNGKWIYPTEEAAEKLGPGPFVELPGGVVINPMSKVQKVYENGLEDGIVKFYAYTEALVREKPKSQR